LFGSFAKNQANEQSDIDALVEFLPNTKKFE
jgi:predicted nucleotidyltransferase